jgi:hypothetical protein
VLTLDQFTVLYRDKRKVECIFITLQLHAAANEYQSCVQISGYCAAEVQNKTPYYYSTFEAEIKKNGSVIVDEKYCY